MITAGIIIYALGAIGTMVLHLMLIIGPVTRPWNVVLTGIGWPFFLPALIGVYKEQR